MIHTSRTVTVGKMESVINEPIMLYRGDREVEIEFNIVGSKFMFSNGGNVIKSTNATNGQLVINTPTGENMFSEVTECNDGKVICVIAKEMIDELAEVGFYSFQIRLFDESQVSRVTIPPVYQGIEIRNPIAAEDETDLVDIGLVDFSVVRKDNYENVVTFLPNGDYNKTLWEEHDVISKDRLNKVEDALYEINKGTEGLYPTFQNQYDEFSAKVNKDVKAYKEEMEDEVEQFERDMTQAFGEFKVDYRDDMYDRMDSINTQLEHIAINVKTKGVKGDGITDDTQKIQEVINYALENKLNVYFPEGNYIITNTIKISTLDNEAWVLQNGFKLYGAGESHTIFKAKMSDKSVFRFENTNNGSSSGAIVVERFRIEPYDNSYKQLFDGIVLVNSMGNIHKNIYIQNARNGVLLTTNNDTSIYSANTGYCEQNVFEDMHITGCLNCITFRVGDNDDWASSFHGNIFERVMMGINGSVSIAPKVIGLNIESGLIYNCTFNLKACVSGSDNHLIHFNGDSQTNRGNISYECFDEYGTKISTGDNALAKFFLNGNIYGLGNIDWSEYKSVSIGEIDYNEGTAIDENYSSLGRDKFCCDNLVPPRNINQIAIYEKTFNVKSLKSTMIDMWNGFTHSLLKYFASTGSTEEGYIMACKEQEGAGSRFILGTIPHDSSNFDDFVPGFEFRSTGSYINSTNANIKLNFKNGNLYKNENKMLYDTDNVKFKNDFQGNIHYPNGYIEVWGSVAVSIGQNTTVVSLEGLVDKAYTVQLSCSNNTGSPSSTNIVQVGAFNAKKIDILTNFENSGIVHWRVIGYKAYV